MTRSQAKAKLSAILKPLTVNHQEAVEQVLSELDEALQFEAEVGELAGTAYGVGRGGG